MMRCQIRLAAVKADAQEEINDAQKKLDDGKKKRQMKNLLTQKKN